MIVGAYLRDSAPEHGAGAEWTVLDAFTWLAARGHDCRILAERGAMRDRHDGVLIYSQPEEEVTRQHFEECHVVVTQLDASLEASFRSRDHRTPLVNMIHSPHQTERFVAPGVSSLVVFNAQWVADETDWWKGPTMVLHPPIDAARVRCSSAGQCVALMNMSHEKGVMSWWRLAGEMPDHAFLGVMGAYGDQVISPQGFQGARDQQWYGLPPNMRVSGNVRDIRQMLSHSRVVLSLSRTETYGRMAAEAMVSGIPVIAQAGPGHAESCGDAAQYVSDRAVDQRRLYELVKQAFEKDSWEQWSFDALDRARYNQERQEDEMHRFEDALQTIATTHV